MKNFVGKLLLTFAISFVAGFLSPLLAQQSCPELICDGEYKIRTAEDLEAFKGCTEVGYLSISSSSLTNLKGLECLNYVDVLVIENNDSLVNLSGLEGLEWINSEIIIENNYSLINLDGLNNLFDAGNIWITDNNSLMSLEGLGSSAEFYPNCYRLNLINNKSITEFGFESLGVYDELYVAENPSLISLKGLDGLGEFEFLTIFNNDSLINLEGLESLDHMLGGILIEDNDSLSSLKGLENYRGDGNYLDIINNMELCTIEAEELRDQLVSLPGEVNISGNKDCSSNIIDNCLNDPDKTEPGICGCGIPETDTDFDGTPDCIDNCPNDPNKAQPGICGCGIADIDSDGDGIPDCNDNCNNLTDTDGDGVNDCEDLCPNDPDKIHPGTCGCGIDDIDSDGDGILDCIDSNDDGDGLPDGEEQGPDRNNSNYDGNSDGIPDYLQDNVASLHTYNYQYYVTMESPVGIALRNCTAEDNPAKSNTPSDVEFSFGFFGFSLVNVDPGGASTVTLHSPTGSAFNTYYKYGPTPENQINHWYEFLFDGQTGAEIDGNIIILHFVDGLRGDDDLTANGTISDIGAPGVSVDSGDGGSPVVGGSGGGGGGCFISTSNH